MINKITDEIYSALDNDLYFSALALALVLPDACAKAEFPQERLNSVRYKNWYKQYIGKRMLGSEDLPNVDEDVAYSLRCCFLHEGNPNIEAGHGIDKFELMFQEKDPRPDTEISDNGETIFNLKYFDMISKDDKTGQNCYRINVRSYCEQICECVKEYYEENKDKFSFNYTIVNWEEVRP